MATAHRSVVVWSVTVGQTADAPQNVLQASRSVNIHICILYASLFDDMAIWKAPPVTSENASQTALSRLQFWKIERSGRSSNNVVFFHINLPLGICCVPRYPAYQHRLQQTQSGGAVHISHFNARFDLFCAFFVGANASAAVEAAAAAAASALRW